MQAVDLIVSKYTWRESMRNLVDKRDDNLRAVNGCLGCCCLPVQWCNKVTKFLFYATVVLVTLVGIGYIFYSFFVRRLTS